MTLQTEHYFRRDGNNHTDQSFPGSGFWGFGGVLRLTGNGIHNRQQQKFWEYICGRLGHYSRNTERFSNFGERLHACLYIGLTLPAFFLRKQWYFSTLVTLWLLRARSQYIIPRDAHISLNTLLNQLSGSMTRIVTMLNMGMAFYMDFFTRCSACVSVGIVEIENWVK